jgi:hypothetical protein
LPVPAGGTTLTAAVFELYFTGNGFDTNGDLSISKEEMICTEELFP